MEKECAKKCYRKEARTNSKKINKNYEDVYPGDSSRKQSVNQQSNGHMISGFKPQILKPRISKLENLEAKMASIEVSLSSNTTKIEPQQQQVVQQQQQQQKSSQQSCFFHNSNYRLQSNAIYFSSSAINEQLVGNTTSTTGTGTKLSCSTMEMSYLMEEIDQLRFRLNEKDAIICSMRDQTNHVVSTDAFQSATIATNQYVNLNSWSIDAASKDRPRKDDKTDLIQKQIDNKSIIVNNLKIKLEGLEVKDLDSRIRQAELECLLEKEEMKILNLRQDLMNFKTLGTNLKSIGNGRQLRPMLNSTEESSLYSSIINSNSSNLFALSVSYDNCSPCFYVTSHYCNEGLIVQWSNENLALKKGDRLLEVNGRIVVNFSKSEFLEMLKSSNAMKLKMVIIRSTLTSTGPKTNNKELDTIKEEMSSLVNKLDNKIKENRELLLCSQSLRKEIGRLKNDNQRLHHRTYYLEDQISELINSRQTQNTVSNDVDTKTKVPLFQENDPVSVNASSQLRCSKVSLTSSDNVSNFRQAKILKSSNALVKSSQANNSIDYNGRHHVLQVKIPFSNSESNNSLGSRYMNVPNRNATKQTTENVKDEPTKMQWIHGRYAGADSDSGNYSGDSMDDTHAIEGSTMMTGFIVQRQPQQLCTVTVSAPETRTANHCYMNVPKGNLEAVSERENSSVKSFPVTSVKHCVRVPSIRSITDDLKSKYSEEEHEQWC